jgi:hypothetical protein
LGCPWLNALRPRDIVVLVFMILLINKWNANAALANDAWIAKMNMNADISMEQIQ